MTEKGDSYFFPGGMRLVFVELPKDNGGARLVMDWFVPAGEALVQTRHVHSGPAGAVVERFELIAGSAECEIGGRRHRADAPHVFDVPSEATHVHPRNTGTGEMHVRQSVLPPEPDLRVTSGGLRFFETTAALAQRGKLNRKGEIADPLQSLLTLNDTLMDPTWLPGLPRPLQRAMFSAGAALARMLGYKAHHVPTKQ
jgi:hypothetical protein